MFCKMQIFGNFKRSLLILGMDTLDLPGANTHKQGPKLDRIEVQVQSVICVLQPWP